MDRLTNRVFKSVTHNAPCLQDILEKLAEYEDTGLEPKDILELEKIVKCVDCEFDEFNGRQKEHNCPAWSDDYYKNNDIKFCSEGVRKEAE